MSRHSVTTCTQPSVQPGRGARGRRRARMEFERRKAAVLEAMKSGVNDNSPKGSLDAPIVSLLDTINSHPSYFTTSSCSGRISVLAQPKTTVAATRSKKARGGSWLFVTHDTADPESVVGIIFSSKPSERECELVFRFEPLIIAVECKSIDSAQSLVSIAISSGFRESGITNTRKRVIVAIRCSIRLEVPLGDQGQLMVSSKYLCYLVAVANGKMEANRGRTEGFLHALCLNGFAAVDTKSLNKGDSHETEVSGVNLAEEDINCEIVVARADDMTPCRVPTLKLYVNEMEILGESLEKLFLWGHSACVIEGVIGKKVFIFGGFGGVGNHRRRNESLLLDPLLGKLEVLVANCAPYPRLGHSCSVVGCSVFVIGGRSDPLKILNEVWAFDVVERKWALLQCGGCVFPPRHRHAAVSIGANIYGFGGLNNNGVLSSLHILDTNTLIWHEADVLGDGPSARHSHSLLAYGGKLFMFGGYDGSKPLGDFYSFDPHTCVWKNEMFEGNDPSPRFSHSMFIYKSYIGIIGGCPVGQYHGELSLLDTQLCQWKHVILDNTSNCFFVRSAANVVDDALVVIGGGASCYAFGTKFSKPVKIDLLPLVPDHSITFLSKSGKKLLFQNQDYLESTVRRLESEQKGASVSSREGPDINCKVEIFIKGAEQLRDAAYWVVRVDKTYAKPGQQNLKKFGWLDFNRKAYVQGNKHVCFPVNEAFLNSFPGKQYSFGRRIQVINDLLCERKTLLSSGFSSGTALSFLTAYSASVIMDERVEIKRFSKSPSKLLHEAVASLIKLKGLPDRLLAELPSRWEKLGDITVLPVTSFRDPLWNSVKMELWPAVAKSLNDSRLARQGRVAPTGSRDSTLEILLGDDGWTHHRENGIVYSFDATKCMFSWGNLSEKLRMANLDCGDEIVVDLFAGIGYFVLPFLVRSKARLAYACEWNPHAIEALEYNLKANSVSDRCIVLQGDNRLTAPIGVADRVCLGLLPTSEGSWVSAVRALRAEGGVLHVHGNARDSEEYKWAESVTKSVREIAKSEGYSWEVWIEHLERVKWYAPHVRHLVVDVRCRHHPE